MTPQMEAALNARHGAFYVSAYSDRLGRYRRIGRPLPTIAEAVAAAKRLEQTPRHAGQFLFVDTE